MIAAELGAPIAAVRWTLRLAVVILPALSSVIAYRVAVDMRKRREWSETHRDDHRAIRQTVARLRVDERERVSGRQ